MHDPTEPPNLPRRRFVYRFSVWASFAIGVVTLGVAVVVLLFGLLNAAFVPNEAAFWFVTATLAFGATAVATR